MKKRMAGMLLCFAMVCSVTAGCGQTGAKKEAAGNSAAGQEQTKEQSADGSTVGKNKFVRDGTDLSLWTFQALHVASIPIWRTSGMKPILTNQLT